MSKQMHVIVSQHSCQGSSVLAVIVRTYGFVCYTQLVDDLLGLCVRAMGSMTLMLRPPSCTVHH